MSAAMRSSPSVLVLITSHVVGRGGREAVIPLVLRELGRPPGRGALAMLDHADEVAWERSLPSVVYVGGIDAQGALRQHLPSVLRFVSNVLADFRPDAVLVTEPVGAPLVRLVSATGRPRPVVLSWLHLDPREVRFPSVLCWADGHLGICAGVLDNLPAVARRRQGFVVYNPVDVDQVRPVPRGAPGTPLPLLFVGRLHQQKRADRILDALAQTTVRRWVLHVVGDGPEALALEARARALNLQDRVVWHGWVPDPWSAVPAASLLLLTSRVEGFPVVLLEAIARGVPILAMDCPFGPSEIVVSGQNGWLLPTGDVQGMARVIDRISSGAMPLPSPGAVVETAERFAPGAVARRIIQAVWDVRRGRMGSSHGSPM